MILIVNIFFFFQAEDGIRDRNVTEFRRVLFRSILTLAINRAFQRICCKKRISDIFLSTTAKIISVKKNILHTVAIALPRISKTGTSMTFKLNFIATAPVTLYTMDLICPILCKTAAPVIERAVKTSVNDRICKLLVPSLFVNKRILVSGI